jgi:hypothetical protein
MALGCEIEGPWLRQTEQALQQRDNGPLVLAAGLQDAE